MKRIKNIWREPLVHFLLIGAALFLLFSFTNDPAGDNPNRIVVSPGQVEQLSSNFSRTWLRPPTEDEMAGLVREHVRDEVYYREALAMGLDQNDTLIRRRMRQKMEFILEDLTSESEPNDQVLMTFLQQHPDKFRLEPWVSFRQVYLNPDNHPNLEADARTMMADLRSGAKPEALGDPTLKGYEFSSVPQSVIARSFGNAFAQEIIALEPGDWTGRLRSMRPNAAKMDKVALCKLGHIEEGDPNELAAMMGDLARRYPKVDIWGGCCGSWDRHLGLIAEAVRAARREAVA